MGDPFVLSPAMTPLTLLVLAGASWNQFFGCMPLDQRVEQLGSGYSVVDATVASVSEMSATVMITWVLHGPAEPRSIEVRLDPPPASSEYERRPSSVPLPKAFKVGERLILLGTGEPFRVLNAGWEVWTPSAWDLAVKGAHQRALDEEAFLVELEQERAALRQRRASWRAKATPARLAESALRADVVGLATRGGSSLWNFKAFFKGARYGCGSTCSFVVAAPNYEELQELVEDDDEVIVFLSEEGMRVGLDGFMNTVGLGIVPADAAATQAVRRALLTQKVRRLPLLVATVVLRAYDPQLPDDWEGRFTQPIANAARGRAVIAFNHSVSPQGVDAEEIEAASATSVQQGITADGQIFLTQWPEGTFTVSATRISPTIKAVVVEEPWPSDPARQAAAATKLINRVLSRR